MNDKNISNRYVFIFLAFSFLFVVFYYFYEKSVIKFFFKDEIKLISADYNRNYNHMKSISELIYFNEFLKSDKITEILKENVDLKENLYNDFKSTYSFYKTLDITDIKFYDKDAVLILSMENHKQIKPNNIVKEVLTSSFELNSIFENNFIFAKPIFDDGLNLIGAISIEVDIDSFFKKIEKDTFFKLDKFYTKNVSENNVIKDLKQREIAEINTNLQNFQQFILITKNDILVFLPRIESIDGNDFYVLIHNFKKSSNIYKIRSYLEIALTLTIILLLIVSIVLYKAQKTKIDKIFLQKDFDDIQEQLDLYVNMIETDIKGKIINVSKSFCDLSGYTKDELVGKNINIVRHPDITNKFFQNLWKDLKEKGKWEGEIKNSDKYGNTFWIKGVIFPKYDLKNRLVGYVSIRVDITDAKQLEKINRLLKEDLSTKLNELKMKDKIFIDSMKVDLMSKILDSITHQWKNPILNISSELFKLKLKVNKNDVDKSKILTIHDKIENELKNLSYMLNEVKYLFNKIEISNSLYENVSEILDVLKNEFNTNGIKVRNKIDKNLKLLVKSEDLKNILFNLSKSIISQKILADQEKLEINIESFYENNELVIKIEDNLTFSNKKIIEEILNTQSSLIKKSEMEEYLVLVKLFIQKNGGIVWFEYDNEKSKYFIKLNMEEK